MGNVFSNSNKTKEEVEQDIKRINKITNNDLFFKKTLRTLNFELYSNFFNNIISSKIIFCSVVFNIENKFSMMKKKVSST